ncbi:MAG: XRE family transcriptional regulator [Erysipelotrichia bacterium]|nr:XRE family transcriptional regulator [Erysipelotrichia bacterium]NCC54689.1 XRE family transcriptional regulator [Erysipelotrichia bacterium]
MFAENLKNIRTSKELTQNALATHLNVARQTISKWEKGLSTPDAEMLIRIGEFFEMPVSELLGAKIEREIDSNETTKQLTKINEQLTIKNHRGNLVLKVVIGVIIGIIVINILMVVLSGIVLNNYNNEMVTTEMEIIEP